MPNTRLNGVKKLEPAFYLEADVIKIAKELLGKILVARWKGTETSGRIIETEAYEGVTDKASHAYGGKRTKRNEVMYASGGIVYVYLCYGIHHLVNVVTNTKEVPHAVLIRALEPINGISTMLHRTGKKNFDHSLTRGPGNLSRALGIRTSHSGLSLSGEALIIVADDFKFENNEIGVSPRIGVDYAEEDAGLPYRFYIKNNPFVSGKPK